MADLLGKQIGNYRLIRLLGKGSFADVYFGEHIYLKTQAALKVLRTTVVSEMDMQAFLKEAQTIAQLRHPHIVQVLDFGVDRDIPYLVMDFATGGTLRQRHPLGSQLPLTTILPYIKQVSEALQYAHDKNFIHRDIKPENLLLGSRDELLLSDFGIALVAQSSHFQSEQRMAGTIAYMAPEQIQGKPRAASDQYSLGIIVYEWLSGDRPFHGSFAELCTQQMFASPSPLLEKMPLLSPAVEQVVMTALAKDPRERFESVQVFASALEGAYQKSLFFSPPSIKLPLTSLTPIKPPPEQITPAYAPPQPGTPAPLQSKARYEHRLSRRTLLYLGIGSAIVAGGGIVAVESILHDSSATTATSPTPTATHIAPATPVAPTTTSSLGTTLFTYTRHSSAVYRVAWSPDGKYLASGGLDTTVQVWNATTGSRVYTYRGHQTAIWAVVWSPHSGRIASGGIDKTVKVWNAMDGGDVLIYSGHNNTVDGVAWSPDGTLIASASRDHTVQIWNAMSGSLVLPYNGNALEVYAIAWSPDGKRLASANADNTVHVWDAATGKLVFPPYRGHSSGVRSVAWSPDGSRIASGSQDKTAQVWSATDGSPLYTYSKHTSTINGLAWSHDSKLIASGSEDTTVQLWDSLSGSTLYTYPHHNRSVVSVAWSPVGNMIASASEDTTVQVWSAG